MSAKTRFAAKMRKYANLLDVPGALWARQQRVPLNHYRFFERLKARCPPRTILDIGANRGDFARSCALCFPGVPVHAFEPLSGCQAALAAMAGRFPQIQVHPVALGEQPGQLEMFENKFSASSSLLPMLDRHRELWPKTAHTKTVQVRVETLDRFAAGISLADPIFLKADVQGYELHVLDGAQALLPRVAVAQMEVLFEPLYDGQPDFRTLMNYLAERGFRFWEFLDERRLGPKANLVYADAAFVNERWK